MAVAVPVHEDLRCRQLFYDGQKYLFVYGLCDL